MQTGSSIEALRIAAVITGRAVVFNPGLIWDEQHAVLVDTGYPGQATLVREAIEKAGVPFARVRTVILTHQDIDHIGSVSALVAESPQRIEVLTSEGERPYVQGDLPPLRRTVNPPTAKVDRTVADGEELPYCGGIVVIHTPGHMPGHIVVYHKPSKTLITGDSMRMIDGQLCGPSPEYTLDMDAALQSLKKLAHYDIETVICFHGGPYTGDVNRRIAELASA